MKKLKVILMTLAMTLTVLVPIVASAAIDTGVAEVGNSIQLGNTDPRTTVAKLINSVMLFLGVIAVLIILLGGFKWMTSMGNEEKVNGAKKILSSGVIGLVIVLAAWGITTFVLAQLVAAT